MHPYRTRAAVAAAFGVACLVAACGGGDGGAPEGLEEAAGDSAPAGRPPDVLPTIRTAELPFQYPPALYERRVQANVVLRLFVDSAGRVVPESTVVHERSGHAELDSAALAGSRVLEFTPARLDGGPVGVEVLLPVHFRHPALDTAARDTTGARAPL